MDNSTDFLLTNSAHATRPPLIVNERFNLPPPVAEYGFSALVNIVKDIKNKAEENIGIYKNTSSNNYNKTFLFDTGVSENGVIYNADIFGIDFNQIDGIILSHGHFDHFAGLVNILKRISSSSRRPTTTNNIIKYLELNKDRILNLGEKNYENLVEAFTKNAIDIASSNPTLSLPQSSSPTFPNLSDQSGLQNRRVINL
jgi:metal-dependent hydrolase (beta-lactamase superfamily II)